MERTSGRPDVFIGLIDGPVATDHPDLNNEYICQLPTRIGGSCITRDNSACKHGTYVAGILTAKRGSDAPAICPQCTLLVRPIFPEVNENEIMPTASPLELASAITDCIDAGARVLNISAAPAQLSIKREPSLNEALDHAARFGVIVVVAAGNQGRVGGTTITSHPWVIPVAACDSDGKPMAISNLGSSIGKHGLLAPGYQIKGLGVDCRPVFSGGTSTSTPYVTGTIALLWSEFPKASAAQIKAAVTQIYSKRRTSITPPLLDARAAYEGLLSMNKESER